MTRGFLALSLMGFRTLLGARRSKPICGESWGPALLSSQTSDSRTLKAEKFWRGQGRHICFGDGPFFVCVLLGETREGDQQGYL